MNNLSPSRRLIFIVCLLFAASFLNYLDRQTLSVLKPALKAEFALDDRGYAALVNIFTFCYAASYIASGWVVDRLGARLALTLFIVGWSIATIGCGIARSFFIFAGFRALLGIMEPGNFPSTIRAMTLWAPLDRRAFLMSLTGAGSTVGAIAAVPLVAWLATSIHWRVAFVAPGVAGIALAALWWMVFREPEGLQPAKVSPAALGVPWTKLWGQKSTWGVVLSRLVSDPVWYFCLFWMPGYFQEQKGLSLKDAGLVGWIPFLVGNLGAITCAFLSDRMAKRRGSPFAARRLVLLTAACCGPLTALVPVFSNLPITVFLLSIVATICLTWLLLLPPLIADTFPAGNVASVWAIAGAFGATGAMVFNYAIGRIDTAAESRAMFLVLGCLHPIAAILLIFLVRKVPGRNQPVPEVKPFPA